MGAYEERRIVELEAEVSRLKKELAYALEAYRELADSKLVLSRKLGR